MHSHSNQIHDYAIGEVHSFLMVVSAVNVYILIRMVLAGVHIYSNRADIFDFGDLSVDDILSMVQCGLSAIGLIGVLLFTTLYLKIGPILLECMKEEVYLHLEGNKHLFDNFFYVTELRGYLKLDILMNLEFSTCLFFVVLFDLNQYGVDGDGVPTPRDHTHTNPDWVPWTVYVSLLLLLASADAMGLHCSVSYFPILI